jgi:outer membrane protein
MSRHRVKLAAAGGRRTKHKRMKQIFSLGILATAKGFSQDSTAKQLTLKQCIETAIEKNLDVRLSEAQMNTDEVNWKQAKLNLLPDLNGTASQSFNQGRSIDPFTNSPVTQSYNASSYGLTSGIVLFNGLALQNSIKQNSLAYQASKMDWEQQKKTLTINVILAYLRVLSNQDLLVQAKNQADLSASQVQRLEILNQQGAIAPSELSTLKGQLAGDRLSVVNATAALQTAKIDLCQLMNIPFDPAMQFEKMEPADIAVKYGDTPQQIYQSALEQLPLVKAADLRKESAEKAVKVARGQLFPRLTFNGNAFTNYSSVAMQSSYVNTTDVTSNDYVVVNGSNLPVIRKQDNFSSTKIPYRDQLNNNLYTSFSLNLSIPIFNSLQQRNRIKLAQVNLKTKDYTAKTTRTQLQQAIDQAYVNMTTAFDSYKTLLDQVNSYKDAFLAAEIRFNNGVGNSIDYLTAKNNFDRANISLINARYDYVLRMKILDFYEGKPLW